MNRLAVTLKLDMSLQVRNRFYAIGIGMGVALAIILSQFFAYEDLGRVIPILFLFAIGGSTFLYVAGLVIFEKDEGTLDALTVTPLQQNEYLMSKVLSLTLLASIESAIVVLLAHGLSGFNALLLFGGIVLMGMQQVLIGFLLVVRYKAITEFLFPALVVGLIAQIPFLYFLHVSDSPLFLLIPTSAPTMLMIGGWQDLETWQLLYGLLYSLIAIAVFYRLGLKAYQHYIVLKERG